MGADWSPRDTEFMQAALADIEAIDEVSVSDGELIVRYDPDKLSIPSVLDRLAS